MHTSTQIIRIARQNIAGRMGAPVLSCITGYTIKNKAIIYRGGRSYHWAERVVLFGYIMTGRTSEAERVLPLRGVQTSDSTTEFGA